jgi:pyruvate-formate lyase
VGETAAVFRGRKKEGGACGRCTAPSTLLAHKAGYIDRENKVIVGLQTDQPFKRAIFPYGGLRMVKAGLKASGFDPDPSVHETFTKYRKSHNDGVFDAYTPEIMNCRRPGIITGLPDVALKYCLARLLDLAMNFAPHVYFGRGAEGGTGCILGLRLDCRNACSH